MKAMEDLDVGFAQVGTVIEKKVSFATVEDKPGKRFTLHPNKLYLDSLLGCNVKHLPGLFSMVAKDTFFLITVPTWANPTSRSSVVFISAMYR